MFTLVGGLYQQFTKKEEFYILIIGLDNAGKTTLLERIKSIYNQTRAQTRTVPTIGMNTAKISIENQKINFWDLGGQKELQSLWDKYYDECHGVFFVVDSTDNQRIQQVLALICNFKLIKAKVASHEKTHGVPMLMIANKQDDPMSIPVHELKEMLNPVMSRIGARESSVLAVSALKGDGVQNCIEWMHLRMNRNVSERPPVFIN